MTEYKYSGVKATVKFDKILQRDENVIFEGISGNDLEELNENARNLIIQYRDRNGIDARAEYHLFDVKGSIASTLDAIGSV